MSFKSAVPVAAIFNARRLPRSRGEKDLANPSGLELASRVVRILSQIA